MFYGLSLNPGIVRILGSGSTTSGTGFIVAGDATSGVALRGHEGDIPALAFNSDGRWLATGRDDATVRLWTAQSIDLTNLACRTARRNLTRSEWRQSPCPVGTPSMTKM